MATPKLVCNKCKGEFAPGYMVKRLDRQTEAITDLCMWCAAGTEPPSAFALEYPPHVESEDFERRLPGTGMREQDYE